MSTMRALKSMVTRRANQLDSTEGHLEALEAEIEQVTERIKADQLHLSYLQYWQENLKQAVANRREDYEQAVRDLEAER